jgi:hypothetical protein
VIGVLRVNGALPVRAFSMRPNLEAPGHDTKTEVVVPIHAKDLDRNFITSVI